MDSNVHQVYEADNVGLVIRDIAAGEAVVLASGREWTARQPIPRYHKVALALIKTGEPIIKYGETIGQAREDIQPGEHVHIHNLGS